MAAFSVSIVLIVFWSLDLRGRFLYWVSALFLGAMVSNGLGHFLVTIPDNASLVMDLVPLVFTPQSLFCGFIVAVNALPKWIQWYSWLQPLTYSYRILLHEEFSACSDHTDHEENLLTCARVINRGLADLYKDNSTFKLAATGSYQGQENILEYFTYGSSEGNPNSIVWGQQCQVSWCSDSVRHTQLFTLSPDSSFSVSAYSLRTHGSLNCERQVMDSANSQLPKWSKRL